MKILCHWIISALAIGIAAYFIPGVQVTLIGALVLAIVLGLLNLFIRPILLLLTLPINILTLGLFTLVINTLLIMLASGIVKGFNVSGFWPAFWFSIVLAIINIIFRNNKKN